MLDGIKLTFLQQRAKWAEFLHDHGVKYMSNPIGDQIFDDLFRLLVKFVDTGGLDDGIWEGAEGVNAEFEINQLYVWYTKVWPELLDGVNSMDELIELYDVEQRHLHRLIEVRAWLNQ